MAKRLVTITIDEDVYQIIKKMKTRDMNRSKHINSLLRYSERCNFIIETPPEPKKKPYDSGVADSGIAEEDRQQIGETDEDYKERLGIS